MGRLVARRIRKAGLAEPERVRVDELLRADLLALGALADDVRQSRHGKVVRIGRARAEGPTVEVVAGKSVAPAIEALRGGTIETVAVRPDRSAPPTGEEILRAAAACRIVLDTAHVAVSWEDVGIELAQVVLSFGADELLGPVLEEDPLRVIGSERGIPRAELADLLRKAEREVA